MVRSKFVNLLILVAGLVPLVSMSGCNGSNSGSYLLPNPSEPQPTTAVPRIYPPLKPQPYPPPASISTPPALPAAQPVPTAPTPTKQPPTQPTPPNSGKGPDCPKRSRSRTPNEIVKRNDLAVTNSHNLILIRDRLYSWGQDTKVLSHMKSEKDDDGRRPKSDVSEPKIVAGPLLDRRIDFITAGPSGHSAAVTERGELFTWGKGISFSEKIVFIKAADQPAVFEGTDLKEFKDNIASVSLGTDYAAVVTRDGKLYTWGHWSNGKLGLVKGYFGNNDYFKPTQVPFFEKIQVSSVALGAEHTAAIARDGTLYTWGLGTDGRLGLGNYEIQTTPQEVHFEPGEPPIQSVALGPDYSAAVTVDGDLYTWGNNYKNKLGHLGYDDRTEQPKPKRVEFFNDKSKNKVGQIVIKSVAVGANHIAALTDDGHLYTWGDNSEGQLGHDSPVGEIREVVIYEGNYPPFPQDDVKIKAVSVGAKHTVVITEHDRIFGWGNGQALGLGKDSGKITEPKWIPYVTYPYATYP